MANLRSRPCWIKTKTFTVSDVVLLKENNVCRDQWRLCRISELIYSHGGLGRRVKFRVGDHSAGPGPVKAFSLERPAQKLVILIPKSEQ